MLPTAVTPDCAISPPAALRATDGIHALAELARERRLRTVPDAMPWKGRGPFADAVRRFQVAGSRRDSSHLHVHEVETRPGRSRDVHHKFLSYCFIEIDCPVESRAASLHP